MSLHNKYDIIIIGGGISGLYSAYKILKMAPETRLLVLEGHKKSWLGGRLGNEMFQGTQVVTGAGVGRKEKDFLLIDLLRELKVPYSEFQTAPKPAQTISPPCNVKKIINILKKQFKEQSAKAPIRKTFKEFALPILGPELYKNLTICLGYTDYENEDVHDTLYNYGLEDNFDKWTALHIPWKLLIETIAKKIGYKNIHCSNYVTNIEHPSPCNFIVNTEKNVSYSCNKVILATTISSVLKLLPGFPIYKQIHGQTFLRLYGKFTKHSTEIMKQYVSGYTVVPGPLQKIIPMNPDKGVYMIAYSDNEDAKYLKDRLTNTQKNREYFCELLEEALGIPKGVLNLIAIKDYYWPIGTHYYEPLSNTFKNRKEFIKKAQTPVNGMLVVGEMISMNQGWTQGALESVDSVLTKKWVDMAC
jgi:hypothetical protein